MSHNRNPKPPYLAQFCQQMVELVPACFLPGRGHHHDGYHPAYAPGSFLVQLDIAI